MSEKSRKIKISGAGVSGLTAAINLAINGYDVTVVERKDRVGFKYKGDFQGLENWTSSGDILEYLCSINIPIGFDYEPFSECYYYNSNLKKHLIKSQNVGFYIVKRGPLDGTIDNFLYRKAVDVGVTIEFNRIAKVEEVDIIATGSPFPFLIGKGITFKTNVEKIALGLFDDEVAPKGYAYLICISGQGTLATVSKMGTNNMSVYLEKAIKKFKKIVDFDMDDPINFTGVGTRFRAIGSGIPKVGEAAGFQDAMWGFGLRMAFQSGYLAAKSICQELDYWKLVQTEIVPHCMSSVVNRFLYDYLGKRRYGHIISKMSSATDPVICANKIYAPTIFKRIIFPLANKGIVDKKSVTY